MKKSIISTLLILFITLGLVSCANQIKSKTKVSMTFDVKGLYNEIASRNADDKKGESVLEVQLFVNDKSFETKTNSFDNSSETITFEFKDIPLNSTVYAEAFIKSGEIVTYYGVSDRIIVAGDNIELSLILKKQETTKGEPTEIEEPEPIHEKPENPEIPENYDITARFYIQKTNASGNPINEYEIYKSVPISSNKNVEAIIDDESLQEHQNFLAIYTWTTYDLMMDGFDLRENIDPAYANSDQEIVFENGICYLNNYFNIVSHPVKHQVFQGNANGTLYSLDLYDDFYFLKNQNDEKIAMGMTVYDDDSHIFAFLQFLYKNNDKLYFPEYFYVEGVYDERNSEEFSQQLTWSDSAESFEIKYYSDADPVEINFEIPEGFSLTDLFNSENHNTNPDVESNVIWEVYVQKKDASGQPLQNSYELYDTYYIDCDNVSVVATENLEDLLDDNREFNITYWWIIYDLVGKNYDVNKSREDGREFTYTIEDNKLTVKSYFDLPVTGEQAWNCKEMHGSAGELSYTLRLYDPGIFYIDDSNGKPVLSGTSAPYDDKIHFAFIPMSYNDNGKIKYTPNCYKDGEFIFDKIESPRDLEGIEQITWTAGGTFTISCYDGTNSIPITFTIPNDFNIFDFIKDESGSGGNGDDEVTVYAGIVINDIPKFSINQTYSDDPIYLNDGLFSFYSLVTEQTNDWTWSVKLFDAGKEVPATAYEVTTSESSCSVRPIALPCGNSYESTKNFIAHVTASQPSLGTVSSNFMITVQNKNPAHLNLNDEAFLTKLIDLFANATGPIELKISGTGLNSVYNPDANVYNMISYTIKQYAKSDVDLDFSLVVTPNVNFLDLNDFTSVVKKITLPASITAIRFNPQLNIQIATPEDNYYTDETWYSVTNYDSNVKAILDEIFAGTRTLNESTRNEMESRYASCDEVTPPGGSTATTSWETIAMWIGGNYRNDFEILETKNTIFVKGE